MPIVDIPDDEYDEDALPDSAEVKDDLLTQDEVDGIVQKRLQRQESRLKNQLVEDEQFWQEMAQQRGVELREDGLPKGTATDEEIQELRRKASKAESLQSELEEKQETIQSTRQKRLRQDLRDKAPTPANETARDTFLSEAERRMTYDDEYGWVKTDEDGEIVYEAGEPVGPDGVVGELEDSHEFLFESTSVKGGSDVEPGGSPSGTMSQEEYHREVKKARQQNDPDRMNELKQMEAEGKIATEE